MQLEKRTLPGRVKLVAVALLALSAVVGVWLHMASEIASAEVQSQSSLVISHTVHVVSVHKATTDAEAQEFCASEYHGALNHVGFVCALDEKNFDPNVVLKLSDERPLVAGTNAGAVTLLDTYQVMFDVKIQGTTADWSGIFTLDAGDPKVGAFGRQPAIYLYAGSSKFLVVWGTLANGNGVICDGQETYQAPIGEYLHIALVNKPTGVEFYVDGVLRCHKEGDFVGRNRDAIVWLTSGDWPAANAVIKNLKIKTW